VGLGSENFFRVFNDMTDRIDKNLNKLSDKERMKLTEIIKLINSGNLEGLDLKKLKGRKDIYRVRKGGMRVIFLKNDSKTYILAVERRTDTTY
jgi:mRNA-degrading endonuclease RelE of RelBE toxin-antitoxin system